MSDKGSEFRSREFGQAVVALGVQLRFIHAGRPADQRLREVGAGHPPQGVLEALVRPAPHPEADWPVARPIFSRMATAMKASTRLKTSTSQDAAARSRSAPFTT